jgi:hypothetical protein
MTPIFTVAWPQTGPLAKSNTLAAQTHRLHPALRVCPFIAYSSWIRFF